MGTPFRKLSSEERDARDKRIIYLYQELGLTQAQVAKRLSTTRSAIHDAIARLGIHVQPKVYRPFLTEEGYLEQGR